MQKWVEEILKEKVELQVAPLIDVVFLLLIYFMVTSSLKESEADLGISLPGVLAQAKSIQMPDEQIIEVTAGGAIYLNNKDYDEQGAKDLPRLVQTLIRYRLASESAQTKALITIQGEDDALHERIIDVMNACAAAGIRHVTFGMGE